MYLRNREERLTRQADIRQVVLLRVPGKRNGAKEAMRNKLLAFAVVLVVAIGCHAAFGQYHRYGVGPGGYYPPYNHYYRPYRTYYVPPAGPYYYPYTGYGYGYSYGYNYNYSYNYSWGW
jgi:hypothetical protein